MQVVRERLVVARAAVRDEADIAKVIVVAVPEHQRAALDVGDPASRIL